MGWALREGYKVREIHRIFIHCSDSDFGDVALIDAWHKERGWKGCGYHWVVLNGARKKGVHVEKEDGLIEVGRPSWEVGAHAKGHNKDSLAICMIGKGGHFSMSQIAATAYLTRETLRRYSLPVSAVYGHYQVEPAKTCPGFRIEPFRRLLLGD